MSDRPEEKQESAAAFGSTKWTAGEEAQITALLQRKLAKEDLSTRAGAGNQTFTYVESSKLIERANYIFGFTGWSCSVMDVSQEYCEDKQGRWQCGYSAIVRITLQNGSFHEDIGWGDASNPGRAGAIEKAKKEAITDARKRALRLFGNGLGNCIYDKSYVRDVRSGKTSIEALDLSHSSHLSHSNTFGQSPAMPPMQPQRLLEPPASFSVKQEPGLHNGNGSNHNNSSNSSFAQQPISDSPQRLAPVPRTGTSYAPQAPHSSSSNNNGAQNHQNNRPQPPKQQQPASTMRGNAAMNSPALPVNRGPAAPMQPQSSNQNANPNANAPRMPATNAVNGSGIAPLGSAASRLNAGPPVNPTSPAQSPQSSMDAGAACVPALAFYADSQQSGGPPALEVAAPAPANPLKRPHTDDDISDEMMLAMDMGQQNAKRLKPNPVGGPGQNGSLRPG